MPSAKCSSRQDPKGENSWHNMVELLACSRFFLFHFSLWLAIAFSHSFALFQGKNSPSSRPEWPFFKASHSEELSQTALKHHGETDLSATGAVLPAFVLQPFPTSRKPFFPTSQANSFCAAQSFSMHSPFARLLPFFKAFAFFQDSFLFHSLFCSLYSQCCFTESVLGNFQLDLLPLLAKFLQLNLATLQFLLVLCCLAP